MFVLKVLVSPPFPYLSLLQHPALQKIHLKVAKNGKGLQLISQPVT